MRRSILTMLLVGLSLGFSPLLAEEGSDIEVRLIWGLGGTQTLYECEIPPTELGTTLASCHDHDIVNVRTGEVIGTGVDTSADVEFIGDGIVATGTTFFSLPEGEFTIRGTGSIQPSLVGSPVIDGHPVTHIAGIFPDEGDNMVIEGTGAFAGASGSFTLLGALDLTLPDVNSFHCFYEISLVLKETPENRALIASLLANV